jgi:hypothetical protein
MSDFSLLKNLCIKNLCVKDEIFKIISMVTLEHSNSTWAGVKNTLL